MIDIETEDGVFQRKAADIQSIGPYQQTPEEIKQELEFLDWCHDLYLCLF